MVDLGSQTANILAGAGKAGTFIVWAMFIIVIVMIVYIIYTYSKYNIKFRGYILTKDKVLEFDDKLRKIKKKGKTARWRLWKRKEYIPAPPKDALRITSKGKLSCTAFYTEDGQWVFVKEELSGAENKEELFGEMGVISNNDRSFYEQEFENAKMWEHKDWSDVVRSAIPYIVVFLILVVFLSFYGKIIQPSLELSERLIQVAEQLRVLIENGQVVNVGK